MLDYTFKVNDEPLKQSIIYIYNTDSKQIYQTPQTNNKGEVRFSIKKENPHSNTLLYFSLNIDDFFDNHFAKCRSYQIIPCNKIANKANITLSLEQTKQAKHIFKLIDSTTNTTAKQWQLDREKS